MTFYNTVQATIQWQSSCTEIMRCRWQQGTIPWIESFRSKYYVPFCLSNYKSCKAESWGRYLKRCFWKNRKVLTGNVNKQECLCIASHNSSDGGVDKFQLWQVYLCIYISQNILGLKLQQQQKYLYQQRYQSISFRCYYFLCD